MPATTKTFQPSQMQSDIFAWGLDGTGHAVVKAAPGSGKTTTLLQMMIRILERNPQAKVIYAAFGKPIQLETNEKIAEMKKQGEMQGNAECRTVNSIGNGILTGFWYREHPGIQHTFDEVSKKYRDLAKVQLLDLNIDSGALASMIVKLVNICRVTLTEPTERNILSLIDHYGIDIDPKELSEFWETVWRSVGPVMEAGKQQFLKQGFFDFGDQVWLPNVLPNLSYPQYDFVLADEAQDFNRAQTELVKRLVRNGRLLFCGDENQSIFGFNGADTESIPNIIKATNAKVLPLSVCYRCPTDVVGLAAQIYPGIEAAPNAPKGIVQVVSDDDFITRVRPGDMVLCRTNAPLISNCLRLLRAGIKAQVRGRDIGKQFKDMLKDFEKRIGFSIETAPELAERYRREQLDVYMRDPDKNAYAIAVLHDKVDTFKVLIEAYALQCNAHGTKASVFGFCGKGGYIDSFFAVDEEKGEKLVLFSTGHKAKGLEKERVWVLEPGLLPHPAAKKAWEMTQEYNLLYVIVSRAKYSKTSVGELYFVGGKPASLILPGQPEQETLPLAPVVVTEVPNEAIALPAASVVVAETPAQRLVRDAAAKLNKSAHGELLAQLIHSQTVLEAMDDPELQQQYETSGIFAEILDAAFALEMEASQKTLQAPTSGDTLDAAFRAVADREAAKWDNGYVPAKEQAYLETADTCPGCGAPCDLSGKCCVLCGLVFSNRELAPAAPTFDGIASFALAVNQYAKEVIKYPLVNRCYKTGCSKEGVHEFDMVFWCDEHYAAFAPKSERSNEPQEDEAADMVAQLLAEKRALEAEVQRLRAENERLRHLAAHDGVDMSDDEYNHLPNHLKPKVGRTKKEGAEEHPERMKGTGRRQPLQLSLDPLDVQIVKGARLNASAFFEEQLHLQEWYKQALEMLSKKAG